MKQSKEGVAPLLAYKEFKKDMKATGKMNNDEYWKMWDWYAKDNGISKEDAQLIVDTFAGYWLEHESFAMESVWKCSLCNMELEETDDVEQRKQRHEDFHKDESIEKGGRQRNWTFGTVDWTLTEPSTKTSLYETYIEEVAEELYWDLVEGVVTWEEITDEMREDVKKYVDDNKLYMSSPAKEGGYGSGKNRHGFGHSKWMKGAELNDDIIDAEDMHTNQFLPMQLEETKNPFLDEYNKTIEFIGSGFMEEITAEEPIDNYFYPAGMTQPNDPRGYVVDTSDVKATGHDIYTDMAEQDYDAGGGLFSQQDYEDEYAKGKMRESKAEELMMHYSGIEDFIGDVNAVLSNDLANEDQLQSLILKTHDNITFIEDSLVGVDAYWLEQKGGEARRYIQKLQNLIPILEDKIYKKLIDRDNPYDTEDRLYKKSLGIFGECNCSGGV